MNRQEQILILKWRIKAYEDQLPLLCDEDYYHCCDMIEQLQLQLNELENENQ